DWWLRLPPAMALRRICIERPFSNHGFQKDSAAASPRPGRSGRRGPQTALDSSARPDNHGWEAGWGAVMGIVGWLGGVGLGKYEAAFRENEIDETVLPSLTDEHLKELGVTALGHRVKLLDAIAALRSDKSSQAPSSDLKTTPSAPSAAPEDRAE